MTEELLTACDACGSCTCFILSTGYVICADCQEVRGKLQERDA